MLIFQVRLRGRELPAIDVRAALPAISCPTLVIHRKDIRLVPATAARHVAEQIPGSRYLELDGQDMFPFVGDSDAVLDAIEEFLTGAHVPASADRVLATLLFTDIVGSTQALSTIGDTAWSGPPWPESAPRPASPPPGSP